MNNNGLITLQALNAKLSPVATSGSYNDLTDKLTIPVVGANNHDCIDLGLPSGTLWASMNIGAEKPEEYGLYFAWGETQGYTADISDGRLFNWASYKWMTSGKRDGEWINKYQVADGQTPGCWYDGGNFVGDGKTTLELADDAARANWGGQWVMPTYEDMRELFDNTTNEWTTLNGVYGCKFTSKVNGNSIFLPAAGDRVGNLLYDQSSDGYYWSSAVYPSYSNQALSLLFNPGGVDSSNMPRDIGLNIRAVLKPQTRLHKISVTGNYNDLENKPTIPNVAVVNLELEDVDMSTNPGTIINQDKISQICDLMETKNIVMGMFSNDTVSASAFYTLIPTYTGTDLTNMNLWAATFFFSGSNVGQIVAVAAADVTSRFVTSNTEP